MIVLMNNELVFPVEDVMYNETPGLIFLKTYNAFENYLVIPFNLWLYDYFKPHINHTESKYEQRARVKKLLKDPEYMKLGLLSLFPSQYDMSEDNWKYISTDMKQYKINKGKMKITENLIDFDEMYKYFQKNINSPIIF